MPIVISGVLSWIIWFLYLMEWMGSTASSFGMSSVGNDDLILFLISVNAIIQTVYVKRNMRVYQVIDHNVTDSKSKNKIEDLIGNMDESERHKLSEMIKRLNAKDLYNNS